MTQTFEHGIIIYINFLRKRDNMAAFDKVLSGFPGFDEAVDYIRMGDNVVWQVDNLRDFKLFMEPFAKQAIADGRNLIYMRFAHHAPLLEPTDGLKIYEFDPDLGFETFTMAIYDRITAEGRDAFYVFDSLSELQSAWYTDLMMGNFFRVTCPYLFRLDTVAYFPLIRGRHSFDAVARIRDTTQLLLNVYTDDETIYLHPLKVWNRYSNKMFLPHSCARPYGEETMPPLAVVEGGVALSRFYQLLEETDTVAENQNYDSYDRFFTKAKQDSENGTLSKQTIHQIVESTMSRDKRMQELIEKFFKPKDYFKLRARMIGSGSIGGKACGMLLARKISRTNVPEYRKYSEPHDSYYIGSDVFYTYIVANGCWETRIEQRTKDGYFKRAPELKQALLHGEFPPAVREQFRQMLDYFGQSPIIVRSSSFLEDGFGNAFAGKYESVFCVNQGTPEERLVNFEQAVRTVYASTMDISALEYRRQRGLSDKDEQMAVLVQRVSGTFFGGYFMPAAAGVGYSYCSYRQSQYIDPEAGMLRIVMGLGTRAVDRAEDDYPRIANLDRPAVTTASGIAEKHQYSQRNVDALDVKSNSLVTLTLNKIVDGLPYWYKNMVLEHDYEAESRLRNMGQRRDVWFISCQRLLENKSFTGLMRSMLKSLESAYGNPVDIEYTVNLDEHGDFVMNLLQCRPLYTGQKGGIVNIPDLPQTDTYFKIQDSSLGASGEKAIDIIIKVDPKLYSAYPHSRKPDVAAAVGKINAYYRDSGKNILLVVPGRIGTSSPELGVPVSFADISNVSVVCEVAFSEAGVSPELSFGSHMFQDLVEADISYTAIFGGKRTLVWNPNMFDGGKDIFADICPDSTLPCGLVRVTQSDGLNLWIDGKRNLALAAKQ